MTLQLKVAGKSDRGLVRPANEDYLHLDEGNAVFAVCDGMGGHQAGEVASMTASETIGVIFARFQNDLSEDERLSVGRDLPGSGLTLLKSIRLANRRIYQRAAADPALSGMGTTIVATAFEQDLMSIAHVGDSRAYRLEDKRLQPLTRDHSWVSELRQTQRVSDDEILSMVNRNVITRALGVRESVEIDYRLVRVAPGDVYILCSDGLCGFADDDEIFSVADPVRSDPGRIADRLIQLANDRGGSDNVTVIAIEIRKVDESRVSEADVFTLPEETAEQLQAEDEWLARLTSFQMERGARDRHGPKSPAANRLVMTLIFVAFIIVAAIIVLFQGLR